MLQKENTGLLIIDVQGKLARLVHQSEQMITQISKLIRGCKVLNIPIVWLEQYPQGLGETVSELKVLLEGNQPLEKFSFNAGDDKRIIQTIKESGRKQWLICGIEAHICVYQSAIGLQNNNYDIEVVTDCISSRTEESLTFAIQKLQSKNIGLTQVEMCLYELVKNSKMPVFKDILSIIK